MHGVVHRLIFLESIFNIKYVEKSVENITKCGKPLNIKEIKNDRENRKN